MQRKSFPGRYGASRLAYIFLTEHSLYWTLPAAIDETLTMRCMQAFGYYASGSESESTLRDNEASFKRYRLVPRLMVDVSKVDTTVTLLGGTPLAEPATRSCCCCDY